jgi:predicted P-loop ATPase/GTPase
MIQSTIYHIRQEGKNIYDPEEGEKYYSHDFLTNERHTNDKVEQELIEFKQEIDEKVEQNATRHFVFPRPFGEAIRLNTESNRMD